MVKFGKEDEYILRGDGGKHRKDPTHHLINQSALDDSPTPNSAICMLSVFVFV